MTAIEVSIRARGHTNVSARHASTLEVTADDYLTSAGDCIVGIEADRTPAALPKVVREACRDSGATIILALEAGGEDRRNATADDAKAANDGGRPRTETVVGRGDPDLTLDSDRSMVARTSKYVDDRTVMVEADKAATDLDRAFVAALAAGAELRVVLRVE